MHRFAAPGKPADFESAVEPHRLRLETLFAKGKLKQFSDRDQPGKPQGRSGSKAGQKPKPKPKDTGLFPPVWGKFKDALSAAQNRKCAFCEGWAVGQSFGDVEHYSPKSKVEALDETDPSTWGREVDHLAKVEGRRPQCVSPVGYWWRAYEWENYLLACAICNQQWKRALFPIREARSGPPKKDDVETHLLLHPFRWPLPGSHLEFGRLGEITAKDGSEFGLHTIRTIGLDRPSLREQRRSLASRIHRKIDALGAASVERQREMLEDIREEGAEDQPFCGMVRSIFEQRTHLSWHDFEAGFKL